MLTQSHTQTCHSNQPWIPPTRRRNTDCFALKSSKRPRRRNTRNINKGAVKSYGYSLGPRSRCAIQDLGRVGGQDTAHCCPGLSADTHKNDKTESNTCGAEDGKVTNHEFNIINSILGVRLEFCVEVVCSNHLLMCCSSDHILTRL